MAEQKKNIKWRGSDAQKILLNDLDTGVLSSDVNQCSAEEAWEKYGSMLAFVHVPYSQFCKQLAAHREQAKRIDWKNSEAREILIKELQNGNLPLDERALSAKEAWEKTYSKIAEFKDVPFSQFADRLADHRKQVEKDHNASIRNEVALLNSRSVYPRAAFKHNCEKVFDMSPAKDLLRSDIKANFAQKAKKTPEEIRLSRPEYLEFKKDAFHNHVRQEERRRKRVNSKQPEMV